MGVATTAAFKCAKALSGRGGALPRTLGFAGGWLGPALAAAPPENGAGAAGGNAEFAATASSTGTGCGENAGVATGGSGVARGCGAVIMTGSGAGLIAFGSRVWCASGGA